MGSFANKIGLLLPLVLVVLAFTLHACGTQRDASVDHGVIKIRSGVSGSPLRKSVLGVRTGTKASTVQAKFASTASSESAGS
jgi:hypothetical protein